MPVEMGFYERWILPRLLELSMRHRRLDAFRRRTVPLARGIVLEIGVGSGLNFPLYSADADRVYAIDPSPEMLRLARPRASQAARPVLLMQASAEDLPLRDGSVDTVVTTWTLCTIPDAILALREMRRVLKAEGRLLFVEHGLSPEARIEHWQHRLTPCWKRISGGCHLDRKIDDLIRAAGFEISQLRSGYMKGPKLMTFMYEGAAQAKPP